MNNPADLDALAHHLDGRREAILLAWRAELRGDPELTTGASLPRTQIDDHVPGILAMFIDSLRGVPAKADDAAAHGLHRWQQGYDLREVTRELGRLNGCVVLELETIADAHAFSLPALAAARLAWARLSSHNITESTAQYYRLRQVEAASHVKDLEHALEELRELEKQRAELWQQAAHDLRGNLGVVVTAASGIAMDATQKQAAFLPLLERNLVSLRHLIDDVTGLARLQAGKEERSITTVDVAELFTDLCDGLQAYARQRGLELTATGKSPFIVEADPVKVRRLTQNLVINALKYTHVGTVILAWDDAAKGDNKRWQLTVTDTGPGLNGGPGSPIAKALGEATALVQESEQQKPGMVVPAKPPEPLRSAQHTEPGEGIGLSIVKRLAELLDASVEIDSVANVGTVFRVMLPRNY